MCWLYIYRAQTRGPTISKRKQARKTGHALFDLWTGCAYIPAGYWQLLFFTIVSYEKAWELYLSHNLTTTHRFCEFFHA